MTNEATSTLLEVQEICQLIDTSQGFAIEIHDVRSTCSEVYQVKFHKIVIQLIHFHQIFSSMLPSDDRWLDGGLNKSPNDIFHEILACLPKMIIQSFLIAFRGTIIC